MKENVYSVIYGSEIRHERRFRPGRILKPGLFSGNGTDCRVKKEAEL
jgi:hypothetical protein